MQRFDLVVNLIIGGHQSLPGQLWRATPTRKSRITRHAGNPSPDTPNATRAHNDFDRDRQFGQI
jgi:hypothetical protein